MFPFLDSDIPQEDVERIVRLLGEAQKHSYQAQARWEALVKRVIGVLQDWFEAMEEETAFHRHPSIDCTLTDEQANRLIDVIDNFFESEVTKYPEYWANRKQVDAPPQFSRLKLHARKALAEDLRSVLEEAEAKIVR
jgi:hypothetical protein